MTYEIRDGVPHVMGRAVAWAKRVEHYDSPVHSDELAPWRIRGFWVPLENGLYVSTQFGTGNYCENHHTWLHPDRYPFTETPGNVELACWWDHRGEKPKLLPWGTGEDADTVHGWVPAELWWDLIAQLGRLPTGRETVEIP